MKEARIRKLLHRHLKPTLIGDDFIIDELGVYNSIVDVAVIGGWFEGYEIKGASDTLTRLQSQIEGYSKVFDRMTIVCERKHLEKAMEIIPHWWGVMIAETIQDEIPVWIDARRMTHIRGKTRDEITVVRKSRLNPSGDAKWLAYLLWRDEALDAVERHGIARGVRGKSREVMCDRLAEKLAFSAVRDEVRDAMLARPQWESRRIR